VEYPQRCLDLIKALEPIARRRALMGSFSLLTAAAVFIIPYERSKDKHPLHKPTRDVDLFTELKALESKLFIDAPFWNGRPPSSDWRFSRIMRNVNDAERWVDKEKLHPLGANAKNSLKDRKADLVLRVIRNSLAHGNIVYLNDKGFEQRDTKLQFLGFLSRYEESEEDRAKSETYRLVTTTEDEFLRFVKCWAKWVSKFRDDNQLSEAA
jgi:hypothetical protein